jgi:hypothetical protein
MPRRPMRGTVVSMICNIHHIFVMGDVCPMCTEEKSRSTGGPAVHIFKPMVYTDICETPILIESKRQLRVECKKHNVIAARLL